MGRNGADVIRTGKGLTECLGWGRRLWAVGMGVLLVNAAGFGEEDGAVGAAFCGYWAIVLQESDVDVNEGAAFVADVRGAGIAMDRALQELVDKGYDEYCVWCVRSGDFEAHTIVAVAVGVGPESEWRVDDVDLDAQMRRLDRYGAYGGGVCRVPVRDPNAVVGFNFGADSGANEGVGNVRQGEVRSLHGEDRVVTRYGVGFGTDLESAKAAARRHLSEVRGYRGRRMALVIWQYEYAE